MSRKTSRSVRRPSLSTTEKHRIMRRLADDIDETETVIFELPLAKHTKLKEYVANSGYGSIEEFLTACVDSLPDEHRSSAQLDAS